MRLFDKWKNDWLEKRKGVLEIEFQYQLQEVEEAHKRVIRQLELTKDVAEKELEIKLQDFQHRKELSLKRMELEEQEVEYRIKALGERKCELIKADNELREQIKLLQAKASPNEVWTHAFTTGVSKSLDMFIPTLTEGLDKFKSKIKEEALAEAIARLRVTNKK